MRGELADGQKIGQMILEGKKPVSLDLFLCFLVNKRVARIRQDNPAAGSISARCSHSKAQCTSFKQAQNKFSHFLHATLICTLHSMFPWGHFPLDVFCCKGNRWLPKKIQNKQTNKIAQTAWMQFMQFNCSAMQFVDRSIIPCHYLQIIQSVIKENALNM